MESYPKELIEGVSPLIFAVDAVLDTSSSSGASGAANPNERSSIFESFYNSIASRESVHANDHETDSSQSSLESPTRTRTRTRTRTNNHDSGSSRSYFRYFSRSSRNKTKNDPPSPSPSHSPSHSPTRTRSTKKDFFSKAHIFPVSSRHAFPPSKDPHGNSNHNVNLNIKLFKSISSSSSSSSMLKRSKTTSISSSTAMLPASSSAFHKSSTVTAATNINMEEYYALSSMKHQSVYNILKLNPIQGILPSGWIEKHVHALPSSLLFVTELHLHPKQNATTKTTSSSSSSSSAPSLSSTATTAATATTTATNTTTTPTQSNEQALYDQALLEQHLLHTMENITSTIAKKRDVPIHLVVLVRMEEEKHLNYGDTVHQTYGIGDKMIALQEKIHSIKSVLRLNANAITLLPYYISKTKSYESSDDIDNTQKDDGNNNIISDKTKTTKTTQTVMKYNTKQLSKLQQIIYENSNLYYLTQVRRFKRKYALLHHDKIHDLLPFAIRYCIKIAVFYEFQCSSLENDDGRTSTAGAAGPTGTTTTFKEEEEEKMKREKSIKYWKEAYMNVIEYYHYLIEKEMKIRSIEGQSSKSTSRRLNPQGGTAPLADATDEENDDEPFKPSTKEDNDPSSSALDGQSTSLQDSLPPPPPPPSMTPASNSTPVQGGVEVALVYSPKSGQEGVTIGAKTPSKTNATTNDMDDNMTSNTHSEDMIHQCRAVADWINLKLLLVLSNAITVSNDTSNLEPVVNLANQVRKHAQVFLSKPMTLTYDTHNRTRSKSSGNSDDVEVIPHLNDPTWYFWQFVAHQKQVFAEFMEQCMKKPTGAVLNSLAHDVSCQFSAAKHFMSSGEALLNLGHAMKKSLAIQDGPTDKNNDVCDNALIDNRQRFVGSLAIFELQSVFNEETKRDHSDLALDAFQNASKQFEGENILNAAAILKPTDIYHARLNQLIGGIYLQQGKFDKAIENLEIALSCSKSFPSISVMLENALIYCYKNLLKLELEPTNIRGKKRKLKLSTLNLVLNTAISNILSTSTLSRLLKEASEVSNDDQSDDILIEWPEDGEQPFAFAFTFPEQIHAIEGDYVNATLHLQSNLTFPVRLHDLSVISSLNPNLVKIDLQDDVNLTLIPGKIYQLSAKVTLPSNLSKSVDTKLVELQSIKGEKPKTAGLTNLGGGIYCDVKKRKKIAKGGLCVSCTALKIKIELSNTESSPCVSMKITNKHQGTSPYKLNTKGISTEVDNYVYSAWSRPSEFPLSMGPRCLRVICPQPNFEIIDLTTSVTNGRLMEGTVNRILLKLTAGPIENCRDLKMYVTCRSTVEDDSSKSSSLLDKEQSTENSSKFNSRQPVIVVRSDGAYEQTNIPAGWKMNSRNDGQGARDDWTHVEDFLDGGSSTFTHFDLFRPLSEYEYRTNEICRTIFHVTVSYRQVRKSQCEESRDGDIVLQEYRGSAVWCSPISANISFCNATRKTIPCGIRHINNLVSTEQKLIPGQDTIAVKSSSIAFMKCSVEATEAENHLAVHFKSAKFESLEKQTKVDVKLITKDKNSNSNILFCPSKENICQILGSGMNVSVTFAVRPSISDHCQNDFISARLGVVTVEWSPVSLKKPDTTPTPRTIDEYSEVHGPLVLKSVQSLKFHCPSCHVEKTPFDASLKTIPEIPKVGNPFEVRYLISNQTNLHQRLRVMMNDSDSTDPSNSMLISGVINGEIILGPLEKKILSYSMLVTKVGKTSIPALDVSSLRYNTWVVHGSSMNKIFVSP